MAILAIPDDYPTLSAALVDADDGDEIAIDGGEWITGDLTGAVSVAVTVRGVSVGGTTLTVTDPQGIEVTGDVTFTDLTVSGGGAGRPFQVEGTGQLTLDGVAMVDGTSTDLGGLVLVRDQSDLVAVDASFTGGQALFGGAVAIGGRGGATFTRVTFEHNRVSGGGSDGGAVRLAEDATATFDTCTFTENTSLNHVGGAIALLNGAASATVIGSTFTENVAGTWGGAIALYDGNTLTVSDSTFTANRATDGGAIGCFAGEACTVTVTGSSFVGDVANRGGALFADVGAVSLTDVAFTGSTAADEGGAVFLFAGSIDATDVRFVDAHADGSGGAVYVEDAGVDFVRTVFCRSSADAAGGAIYARRPTAFRVTNASFFGNTAADEGAAIRFRDRTGAVLQ
ncbi:MAG: right-handed parallel beta-helix repeat-containing protein, partial [Myxococcota bacterium]